MRVGLRGEIDADRCESIGAEPSRWAVDVIAAAAVVVVGGIRSARVLWDVLRGVKFVRFLGLPADETGSKVGMEGSTTEFDGVVFSGWTGEGSCSGYRFAVECRLESVVLVIRRFRISRRSFLSLEFIVYNSVRGILADLLMFSLQLSPSSSPVDPL